MLRTLAERVSRGLVLKRRLPASFRGLPIFVSPDAGLRFWRPDVATADSNLFSWVSELVSKGDVVWDVGANVGLFSFAAAARSGPSGHVYSVEADLFLAGLLRRSAAIPSPLRAPVEVLPVAISKELGLAQFSIAQRGRCANFLSAAEGTVSAGGTRESAWVMTVTLDWLLERIPAPHVVKVDIEGAELWALAGAKKLLTDVRPTIICEITKDGAAITQLFRDHGYDLYDAELPGPTRPPLVGESVNILARPR